ncbi:MAG: hypothetical protein AAGL98_04870 [Planctomycetota bacterium]
MLRLVHIFLPVVIFAVVLGTPWPRADAASTQYRVTGELASSPANGPTPTNPRNPRGLAETADGGSFALRLSFDEPAAPDFDLLGFSIDTEPFAADRWSLDLFGATELIGRYDQDTNPDFLGFASFTGELTGIDSGETFITLGVDTDPAPGRVATEDTLISVEFYADELVDVFFTDALTDVPSDPAFDGGSVLDLGSGLRVPVTDAAFVIAPPDGPVRTDNDETPIINGDSGGVISGSNSGGGGGGGGGGAAAVPTPGTAVGGLLLMLLLVVRQLNRTQQRAETA